MKATSKEEKAILWGGCILMGAIITMGLFSSVIGVPDER